MFLYFSTEIYDFTNIEWMPELQLNLENIHLTNLQPGRANIVVSNTAIVKSIYMKINGAWKNAHDPLYKLRQFYTFNQDQNIKKINSCILTFMRRINSMLSTVEHKNIL